MSDVGNSLAATSDGGCIMAGTSNSHDGDVTGNHGADDIWVAKVNSSGTLQWQRSLGGTGFENGNAVVQTADGGYAVAGYAGSINGDVTGNHGTQPDMWLVKLDISGNIAWQKSFGGSTTDIAYSIAQTPDKGFILSGDASSSDGDVTGVQGSFDYWVVKTDSVGNLMWQKTLGGSNVDISRSVIPTSDGGYLVTGISFSNNGDITNHHGSTTYADYWVVKLDGSGNMVWETSLGGTNRDEGQSAVETADGGYAVIGFSLSLDGDVSGNHGGLDYWVAKLNSGGALEWQQSYGGSSDDFGIQLIQNSDGGYTLYGQTASNDGDMSGLHGLGYDLNLIKTTGSGTIIWSTSFGGSAHEGSGSIAINANEDYFAGGYSLSNDGDVSGHHGNLEKQDFWVMKLQSDTTGVVTWFADVDDDSYGDEANSLVAGCIAPSGYVSDNTDCDDNNTAVHPNTPEVCFNSIDDNCNGQMDEGCVLCAIPDNLFSSDLAATSAKLNWDAVSGAEGYKVRYKVSGAEDWTIKYTSHPFKNISGLAANTAYKWQVKTYCQIEAPHVISEWSSKQQFTTGSLRIGDESLSLVSFQIYPNPNDGNFAVQVVLRQEASLSIRVLDVLGREIFIEEEGVQSGTFMKVLQLPSFQPGTYFLEVICNGKPESTKLMIDK